MRGYSRGSDNQQSGATTSEKERCAISKTGTGFAYAKLSEILPAARVARFVRMTNGEKPDRSLEGDLTQSERFRKARTLSTNGFRLVMSTRALAIRTGSPKKKGSYKTWRPPKLMQATSTVKR